ncbi:protein-export chaperone SecB [Peptostreptococcus stomatis]|uniref:protein-export chaperone SecB n=1 Tax=Peptostreptococcus stomatis TaxID=341694 RepID=UPI0026F25E77|nr:protein-export chaperone SecB [Peptostreptococcus stomatis]
MESNSILEFRDYKVKGVIFKINENYEGNSVDLDFRMRSRYRFLNDNMNEFLTELNVEIFSNAEEKNYPFTMNLVVEGFFKVNSNNENIINDMVTKNSISILFPYVRSLVSTYTSNSNVNTLILPPINVLKLVEEN